MRNVDKYLHNPDSRIHITEINVLLLFLVIPSDLWCNLITSARNLTLEELMIPKNDSPVLKR